LKPQGCSEIGRGSALPPLEAPWPAEFRRASRPDFHQFFGDARCAWEVVRFLLLIPANYSFELGIASFGQSLPQKESAEVFAHRASVNATFVKPESRTKSRTRSVTITMLGL
jgi:hypothetical protein